MKDVHTVTPETAPAQIEALRFAYWMLVEALDEAGFPVRRRLLAKMGDSVWLHHAKPEVRQAVEHIAGVLDTDIAPPAGRSTA